MFCKREIHIGIIYISFNMSRHLYWYVSMLRYPDTCTDKYECVYLHSQLLSYMNPFKSVTFDFLLQIPYILPSFQTLLISVFHTDTDANINGSGSTNIITVVTKLKLQVVLKWTHPLIVSDINGTNSAYIFIQEPTILHTFNLVWLVIDKTLLFNKQNTQNSHRYRETTMICK